KLGAEDHKTFYRKLSMESRSIWERQDGRAPPGACISRLRRYPGIYRSYWKNAKKTGRNYFRRAICLWESGQHGRGQTGNLSKCSEGRIVREFRQAPLVPRFRKGECPFCPGDLLFCLVHPSSSGLSDELTAQIYDKILRIGKN